VIQSGGRTSESEGPPGRVPDRRDVPHKGNHPADQVCGPRPPTGRDCGDKNTMQLCVCCPCISQQVVMSTRLHVLCGFRCCITLHSGAREQRPGLRFPLKDISAHRQIFQMSVDPILHYMHICEGSFQCFRSRFSDMSGVGSIYFFI